MANINDKQPIPVDSSFPINQPTAPIYQLPPSYEKSETGRGEIYYQNQDESVYIQSTGRTGPSPAVPNITYVSNEVRTGLMVMHYINFVWAIFNTICCLWPLGCCSFVLSIVGLAKLRDGKKKNLKAIGISTVVLNILATIGGILLFVFYFLPLIRKYRQS